MTRAKLWRALAPTEVPHAAREAYVGYTVRATGRLDLAALETAYAAACHAYPQLAARLEASDAGPVFVASGSRPQIQVGDGDLDHPLAGVELDQYRALSALHVVRDGDDASVCLLTHHSVADARHSLGILATLWSYYTDVVHGVPVEPPRHPYPKSLEDVLAERGIHGSAPTAVTGSMPLPEPHHPVVVQHMVQHRLTRGETAALVELGHRERVTINGLLSGALLVVEAEVRGLPLTELSLRFTVDLRDRLTPRVGATEGTNVLGAAGFTVADGATAEPVAIGRAIGERLRGALADGSLHRSLLDVVSQPARDAKPWDPSRAHTVVSVMNWGQAPPMRTPNGLRLTNLHSAYRRRGASAIGGYVVSTFDGRIGIDLAWPEGDPGLSERVERLREQLRRMTRQR